MVDCDRLLADLLAHPAGTFVSPGNTGDFAEPWEQASPARIADYLWDALENWFFTFRHRVEFEVGRSLHQLDDFSDVPWYSCYMGSFF